MINSVRPLLSHIGIPYRWTEFDAEVERAILGALGKGQEEVWTNLLDMFPVTEGLSDLETSPTLRELLNVQEHERYSLEDKLREINSWVRNFAYDPSIDHDPISLLLLSTVSALNNLLKPNILTLIANGAPSKGHLLYFTSHLHRCFVISYSMLNNNVVDLALVASIQKPKTVFDFFDNIDRITPLARNVLKGMLASGHKIVGHRNTLVHVDRRSDYDVFGPSIDTLYLNELLFKYLYEYERLSQPSIDFAKFASTDGIYPGFDASKSPTFGNVLEIGSGNGLLITSMVKNMAWIDHFVVIDPSLPAINCTYRTSAQQRVFKGQLIGEAKGTYVCSRFESDIFSLKFDAIICNPPYVPTPPRLQSVQYAPFMEAISGTELLTKLLQSLPDILSDAGFLFLVCSSLAEPEFNKSIPTNISIEPLGQPEGIEVPFDVEAVLNNPFWLGWLIENRNLVRRGDVYYHRIRCYILHKSETAGFIDKWGLLQRFRQLNISLQNISSENGDLQKVKINVTKAKEISIVDKVSSIDTIILRFRDIVTPNHQTINLHRQVIDQYGYVWWGWWKKQTEIAPKDLLKDLSQRIHHLSNEEAFRIYLFDSGQEYLFSAQLLQIAFQSGREIFCPEPMAMPPYYRDRAFAAWFKLTSIKEEPFDALQSFEYHSFPTLSSGFPTLVGKRIDEPGELRKMDVTLWWISSLINEQREIRGLSI